MFLSIIIPVYNCEKYLEDCLLSCLRQDLSADEYEILCINDGSTDSSGEILKKYEDMYNHIIVFTQDNKGVSAARNVGLDNAQGEFIMFVDGDDLIRNNVFASLKSMVEQTGCDRLEFGGYIGKSKVIEDLCDKKPNPNCFYPDLLWLNIFRRQAIKKYKLRFIEGITHSEDILFVNDFRNICIDSVEYPETVYYYRRHSGSATDRSSLNTKLNMIDSYCKIVCLCRDRMFDNTYKKDLIFPFWCKHMFYLIRYIPELPYKNRYQILLLLKKLKPYLYVNKNNREHINASLQRKIKASSLFRHFEIIIYANRLGAHLIIMRRKFTDTLLAHILKHPKRFINHPFRFIKSTKS